jgi:hypothetical protein
VVDGFLTYKSVPVVIVDKSVPKEMISDGQPITNVNSPELGA